MPLVLADRVKVRSRTEGTGDFLLENTVYGFQDFTGIGDGNETYYGIVDNLGNWEVGRGTYTLSTNTLSRDTILESSNSNAKINFGQGSKNVFCTYPASIATAAIVGGIPDRILNGIYEVVVGSTGKISYPNDITQSSTNDVVCNAGVDTVIYTATAQYQHAIKLFVMVEGIEDGGGLSWETQACDIIAVKGYNNNIVNVSVYGVTNSGLNPLATFDGQWNAILNRIEITCTPTSATYGVEVKVHAIEMGSND
jgi:hypothetical protein